MCWCPEGRWRGLSETYRGTSATPASTPALSAPCSTERRLERNMKILNLAVDWFCHSQLSVYEISSRWECYTRMAQAIIVSQSWIDHERRTPTGKNDSKHKHHKYPSKHPHSKRRPQILLKNKLKWKSYQTYKLQLEFTNLSFNPEYLEF